jgi:hypothetical protein
VRREKEYKSLGRFQHRVIGYNIYSDGTKEQAVTWNEPHIFSGNGNSKTSYKEGTTFVCIAPGCNESITLNKSDGDTSHGTASSWDIF